MINVVTITDKLIVVFLFSKAPVTEFISYSISKAMVSSAVT